MEATPNHTPIWQDSRVQKRFGLLALGAIGCGALLVLDAQRNETAIELRFVADQQREAQSKSKEIASFFAEFYKSLRAISLIPPLRGITHIDNRDPSTPDMVAAGHFSADGQAVVQQFYNNLALTVPVSEIYLTMRGFSPETGEIPFFMYDELVLGSRVHQEEEVLEDFPEEEEDAEYAVLKEQLRWLEQHNPTFNYEHFDQIPALLSTSIRTCDNTQYYSKRAHEERDAYGHVYSVPVYTDAGELSGVLSAIFRTNQLEALLVGVPHTILTEEDRKSAEAAGWTLPEAPSRFALVHSTQNLVVADRRNVGIRERATQQRQGEGALFSHAPIQDIHDVGGGWQLYYEYNLPVLAAQIQEERSKLAQRLGALLIGTLGIALFLVREAKNARRIERALERSEQLNSSLEARNGEMRAVLDTIDQGLVTIDLQARLGDAFSAAWIRWLGSPQPGTSLLDHLRKFDPNFALSLELGLESLREAMLPTELSLQQLPQRLNTGLRQLEFTYAPIGHADPPEGLLVVVADITEQEKAALARKQQAEVLELAQRFLRDPAGIHAFMDENGELVSGMQELLQSDMPTFKRAVHTLKGNSALLGLELVASACHSLEDVLESGEPSEVQHSTNTLIQRWNDLRELISQLSKGQKSNQVAVERSELARLQASLKAKGQDALARRVELWSMEPASRELERQAEKAAALCERLGRGPVRLDVEGGGVYFDALSWRGFWSSMAHVVRNCVDHGLPPQSEHLPGFEPTLRFQVWTEADQLFVEIGDNGRGINWEGLRQSLLRKGHPAQTHQDLLDGLFIDGVSAKTEVGETSGRGVGMAAVRQEVLERSGSIEVISAPNQGTLFRFRFPLSATIRAAA